MRVCWQGSKCLRGSPARGSGENSTATGCRPRAPKMLDVRPRIPPMDASHTEKVTDCARLWRCEYAVPNRVVLASNLRLMVGGDDGGRRAHVHHGADKCVHLQQARVSARAGRAGQHR